MPRFAITIFISAFLLFLIQPMIGRYILPWFGGAAGVWAVCLVFFQTVLLAGYAYAFALNRWLSSRGQMIVHLVVLGTALAMLPLLPPAETWKPLTGDDPASTILLLLTVCIGIPYVALAATGPLLQAWFARTHEGRSPYRLYALSNVGSLLALLSYPFVIEPLLTRKEQAMMFIAGFVLFAAFCGWCALTQMRKSTKAQKHKENNADAPRTKNKDKIRTTEQTPVPSTGVFAPLMWFLLPACASIMLLSTTTRLTQDIAPIPFLWVLPLAVYLITFIIAFEKPILYWRPAFVGLLVIALGAVLALMLRPHASLYWQVGGYMTVLFVCCMICHGEVYRLRPEPARLTSFYLLIAGGGAAGGAFVSLLCPVLFDRYVEFYAGIFGTIGLLLACVFNDRLVAILPQRQRRLGWLVMISFTMLVGFGMRLGVGHLEREFDRNTVLQARNFYGTLTIKVQEGKQSFGQFRALEHGRIRHGAQIMNEQFRGWRILYYGPASGIGLVMRFLPRTESQPRRVGVVGLGTGTMSAWGNTGDVFRYYEINPRVVEWAREYFTYLDDLEGLGGRVEIVPGDARLSMEREPPQEYDVLVLDAFSGDAIPTHLLTKEAFEVYLKHLKPKGVLAVHVSNRYLDLHPVVHRIGDAVGLKTVFVMSPENVDRFETEAHWVLLSRDDEVFRTTPINVAADRPRGTPHVTLWTDEHTSLLEVLR